MADRPDIFGRDIGTHQSLSYDGVLVEFTGSGLDVNVAVVQNLAVQYAQNISKFWSVTNRNTYYVGGRQQGNVTLNLVVMRSDTDKAFLTKFGDVCNATTNGLKFSAAAACGTPGRSSAKILKHVVITQVSYSVAAADMVVNESIAAMFSALF